MCPMNRHAILRRQIESGDDIHSRRTFPGHVTTSAFILDRKGRQHPPDSPPLPRTLASAGRALRAAGRPRWLRPARGGGGDRDSGPYARSMASCLRPAHRHRQPPHSGTARAGRARALASRYPLCGSGGGGRRSSVRICGRCMVPSGATVRVERHRAASPAEYAKARPRAPLTNRRVMLTSFSNVHRKEACHERSGTPGHQRYLPTP